MSRRSCLLALTLTALASLAAPPTFAQNTDTTETARRWVVLPALFYTPETRWGGGISGIHFFRTPGSAPDSRISQVFGALLYTQNKQAIFQIAPDLYFSDETYRVTGEAGYALFPDNFYGVGPETPDSLEEQYTARNLGFAAEGWVRLRPGFYLGPYLSARYQDFTDVQENGLLDGTGLPGSEGGWTNLLGAQIVWDTRDKTTYTTQGHFLRLDVQTAASAWGSDYAFTYFKLDERQFFSLSPTQVLGFQFLGAAVTGTAPFVWLPQVGGADIMRGYYSGRYRDNLSAAVQAELRQILWGPFGATVFIGAGTVAPRFDAFDADAIKVAGGFGFRLALDPEEQVNIRLDYGFGPGTSGFYMTLGEAF